MQSAVCDLELRLQQAVAQKDLLEMKMGALEAGHRKELSEILRSHQVRVSLTTS